MKTKVDIETSEFDVCLQKVKQEYPKSNGALLDTDTDAWKPECYALNDAIQIENNPFVTSYGCIFKGTMIQNTTPSANSYKYPSLLGFNGFH